MTSRRHSTSPLTKRAAVALFASGFLLVAGCSSPAATQSPTTAPTTAPTTMPSTAATTMPSTAATTMPSTAPAGSITFGDLHPFTGQYASVGAHSYAGALAAASCINDAGGVNGQTLNIATADTVGDPADAVPALNKLLSVDNAVAVIGPGGLEIGAVQSILDSHKIPFMFEGGLSALDNNTDPYLWRDTPSDSQEGVAMALYALNQGYKKAALVFSTIQSAQDFKQPVQSAYEAQGGQIVANVDLTPGQTSYRSEALKVVNSGAEVIFTQMEPGTAGAFFSSMNALDNLAIPFIASDTSVGSDWITAITGPVAQAHLVSVEGSSAPGPGGQEYMSCYTEANGNTQPGGNTPYAYDGTVVLALAMDLAGSTDPAAVVAAIPKVANPGSGIPDVVTYADGLQAIQGGATAINYDGAGTPMNFNQYHNVYGPFDVVRWNDSSQQFEVVTTISAADLQNAGGG